MPLLSEFSKNFFRENPSYLQKAKMVGRGGGFVKFFEANMSSPYNGAGDLSISPSELKELVRLGAVERIGEKYYATEPMMEYIESLGPVNVDGNGNVVRFHATDEKGLNGILNSGAIEIFPDRRKYKRNKFGTPLHERGAVDFKYETYTRPVFTSTESWADEWKRPITLKMAFPVEDYRNFKRVQYNPDHSPYDYREHILSVDRGGTADFIEDRIPIKYVNEICLDPEMKRCYDTSVVPFKDVVDILNNSSVAKDVEDGF